METFTYGSASAWGCDSPGRLTLPVLDARAFSRSRHHYPGVSAGTSSIAPELKDHCRYPGCGASKRCLRITNRQGRLFHYSKPSLLERAVGSNLHRLQSCAPTVSRPCCKSRRA